MRPGALESLRRQSHRVEMAATTVWRLGWRPDLQDQVGQELRDRRLLQNRPSEVELSATVSRTVFDRQYSSCIRRKPVRQAPQTGRCGIPAYGRDRNFGVLPGS